MNLSVRFSNAKHRKLVIARAIACSIMLLVLPACIPNLRHAEPGPGPPPESFRGATSPENSAEVGIDEFYKDPMLSALIHQALSPTGNRELKILNEEVQIARNEVLSRSGAYLPFVTIGGGAGLTKYSLYTEVGASLKDDTFLPGQLLPNPLPNFMGAFNIFWKLDVYRQLRNARDAAAQRYVAVSERRNFFVTRLVAEIAENYYDLVSLDRRLENLDLTIALQERSLEVARALLGQARNTQLGVQRFLAEVRKNQSQKLITTQEIIEEENRTNFLVNRYPQPVERMSADFSEFFDLNIHTLDVGVPSQLLLNRPDIRQAERELVAAGLDVKVARVNFFPQFVINSGVGSEAFNPKYLLITPEALIYNIAGGVVGPVVNFRAIKAEYLTANAQQLQALYNYQRVVLEAVTQVVNRLTKVQNYGKSIEIKKQQLAALVASVEIASTLFQNARADYVDVLFAQRDMMDARRDLIDTKSDQLGAIANTYQALGGGLPPIFKEVTGVILPPLPHHSGPPSPPGPPPHALPLALGPPLPLGPPSSAAPPSSARSPSSAGPPPIGPPLQAGPPPPPGPVNSPVQEKPPTDLEPMPARP
jgi:outer membrane protein, multidrug efflux system